MGGRLSLQGGSPCCGSGIASLVPFVVGRLAVGPQQQQALGESDESAVWARLEGMQVVALMGGGGGGGRGGAGGCRGGEGRGGRPTWRYLCIPPVGSATAPSVAVKQARRSPCLIDDHMCRGIIHQV